MRIVKIMLSIAFLLTLMACSEDFKQGAVEAAQGKSQDPFAEPVTPAAMPFITEETPPAVYNAVVQKLLAVNPTINIAPQPGQLYYADVSDPITGRGGFTVTTLHGKRQSKGLASIARSYLTENARKERVFSSAVCHR